MTTRKRNSLPSRKDTRSRFCCFPVFVLIIHHARANTCSFFQFGPCPIVCSFVFLACFCPRGSVSCRTRYICLARADVGYDSDEFFEMKRVAPTTYKVSTCDLPFETSLTSGPVNRFNSLGTTKIRDVSPQRMLGRLLTFSVGWYPRHILLTLCAPYAASSSEHHLCEIE